MLSSALAYPRRNASWVKTVVIGGILFFLGGVLLLPAIPLEGYLKRVLRNTAHGDREPPVFDDWIDLFVEGIKMFLVQLGYALVPVLLVVLGVFLAGAGGMAGAGFEAVGLLIMAGGVVVGLIAGYLVPAALTNFAYHDDLGAAFDLEAVAATAFTVPYLKAFVLAILVGIVLGLLGSILLLVLVGILVLFYAHVVVYHLWATGFAEARNRASTPTQ